VNRFTPHSWTLLLRTGFMFKQPFSW